MGTHCESPERMHGDNQSVLCSTIMPENALKKKKSQSLAYHLICEGLPSSEWRALRTSTNFNEADLLKKALPNGEK